ncbi:hypothetical protein [Ovoidimarina sediminis]|uniref:hypothetical protein n=1 Tax=Ovoidimarina sediminis TaxID=3079856 RepID=UPI00290A1FB3|nr:hypothetical protein [Rhodophyticola sp. MJ-SS7]MDU8945561.1 hypothetical protein [Rhodophyticola sp. MJ-SS7]
MTARDIFLSRAILGLAAGLVLSLSAAVAALAEVPGIEPFVGTYSGSAELVLADGTKQNRDLNVEIAQSDAGFSVAWGTITFRPDGRTKERSYKIGFVPSKEDGLFAAAMKKDLFGHDVQLDPMKGEPYVWGQLNGDTLTVYALFVDATGGYEIQQYDRTLAEGGLQLEFSSFRNGAEQRSLSSFLKRQ